MPELKLTMNDLAVEVARLEGGKQQLNIAQIKETLRCLADLMAVSDDAEMLFKRYVNQRREIIRIKVHQDLVKQHGDNNNV